MPHIVNIPGVGRVNFPDSMKPEDINREATGLHQQAQERENARLRQSQAKFDAPDARGWGQVALDQASTNVLGVAKTFGLVPEGAAESRAEYPLKVAQNIGEGIVGMGKLAFDATKDFVTGHPERNRQRLFDAVKSVTEAPRKLIHGMSSGDWTEAAEGSGEIGGTALQGLMATPKGRAVTSTAIEKVGGLPVKAGKATVAKVGDFVSGVPLKPENAMVKGIKPRAGNLGFEMGLDRSMPELKAAEGRMGKSIEGIDDLIDATKDAKRHVWSQYEQIQGPQAQRGVSGNRIADAIERSIPLKTKIQNPALAERLRSVAATYRNRSFKIGELEDLLHTTNAELDSFYDKYPTAKRSLADRSPDTAHLVNEGKALRDTIYETLDQAGGGVAPRELKQRYGSLLNLEEEAYRRRNVAMRQQPESLTEQMGRLQAAVHTGKGVIRMATGSPFEGFADIAGAYAGRKAARAIKEFNSTDHLIRTAMQRYRKLPTPVQFEPFRPAGMLSERAGGPFAMGDIPSDIKTPSLVDELPQTWEQMYQPGRLQLPAASSDVPITRTIQRSSGRTFEMPSAPPAGLLTSGRLQLPERAGSPFVTPPPRLSLREELRIRAGKPNLKQELHKK